MSRPDPWRVLVLSVVKHDYIARAVAAHPRFELAVVADDHSQPDWIHQRNQEFATEFGLPYLTNINQAIADHNVQVAVISSEAERHCALSLIAAESGLHIIQDKPMSTMLSECDRVVEAVQRNQVQFLMWNRNLLPAVVHARQVIERGDIGSIYAIHVDFYFAKDAGPPIGSRDAATPPLDWLTALKEAHATGADGGVGNQPVGELSNEGVYPLAYIGMLCGRMDVRRVFARTTAHFHQLYVDNHVEDLASVSLEFDGDLVGSITVGRIGNASHPDLGEIKIHVLGTKGALVIGEAKPEVSIYYRDQPATEFKSQRLSALDNDFFLVENFARAIDGTDQSILNASSSRQISAIVAAAIQSGRLGRPVAVS